MSSNLRRKAALVANLTSLSVLRALGVLLASVCLSRVFLVTQVGRISRTLVVKQAAFHMPISTATALARVSSSICLAKTRSELSRSWMVRISVDNPSVWPSTTVLALITIVVTLAAMTAVTTVMEEETIATLVGTTVTEKTAVPTAVTGLDHLLAVPTMTIVAPPGLLRPAGKRMIRGLQGTMTGEGAIMMIEEALTLIMIVAGTMTGAGTTAEGTRRMTGSKTDLLATRMGIADGRAEEPEAVDPGHCPLVLSGSGISS